MNKLIEDVKMFGSAFLAIMFALWFVGWLIGSVVNLAIDHGFIGY